MAQKTDPAQLLDARAGAALTLAEAQALHAEADRLRRTRRPGPARPTQPIFRN